MSDLPCLLQWVENFLPGSFQIQSVGQGGNEQCLSLNALNGDAGFRQYFRLNTEPPLIAVSAPPEHENTLAFVEISLCFQHANIRTPKIYAVDYQRGFLLLEDFGDQLLLPKLFSGRLFSEGALSGRGLSNGQLSAQVSSNTADSLYQTVETELLKIQQIKTDGSIFPYYDHQLLLDEMALFPQWFVEQLLGIELQGADRAILDKTFSLLAKNAEGQPQVVVHRDFHARNLMLLPDNGMGVIDFQDAVIGPFTYDMVSLFRDCYIRWPVDVVVQHVLDYAKRAEGLGIIPKVSDEQMMRWFDLMGLQRHIKVLGIFARLWLRDSKPNYLDDLPLVIRYTLEQLSLYPDLKPFKHWFEQRVLPELPQQSWYQPWETAGDSFDQSARNSDG